MKLVARVILFSFLLYFSIDFISFDFYCQLKGSMNFLRHRDEKLPLNLEEAGDIVIVAYFLIFLYSLCSIELKMFQILAPAHTPDFINSCPILFVFVFLFIFYSILIYKYFHNFSSRQVQLHLLFQIYLIFLIC